ncbi:MAG TPA: hypothetical protein PKK45_12010 [Leptospiraceae bacterium]|nr:hypothetical protein [Leptospiraceae bacterium]
MRFCAARFAVVHIFRLFYGRGGVYPGDMALTQRGKGWEWFQSWYMLLSLPFGFTTFLAFLYTGFRVKKWLWMGFGVAYLLLNIYVVKKIPAADSGVPADDLTMGLLFGEWLVGMIHVIVIRKSYLLLLEATEQSSKISDDRLRTKIQADYGVSENKIDAALVEFKESDATVRVVSMLFSVFPFIPQYEYYFSLKGAVRRVARREDAALFERAKQLANSEDVLKALKVASVVDKADGGLGIYTGLKNAYDAAKNKDRKRTFEADPQQAADAALKAVALSYMVAALYPGSVADKVRLFLETPAGQEIAAYYAGVEIALPFTDNLIEASGNWMGNLLESAGGAESRFGEFAGSGPMDQARAILASLREHIDSTLTRVKPYLDPLREKVSTIAPTALNIADSTTGAVATALDVLPAWRFLGARLAAEACVVRAMKGI